MADRASPAEEYSMLRPHIMLPQRKSRINRGKKALSNSRPAPSPCLARGRTLAAAPAFPSSLRPDSRPANASSPHRCRGLLGAPGRLLSVEAHHRATARQAIPISRTVEAAPSARALRCRGLPLHARPAAARAPPASSAYLDPQFPHGCLLSLNLWFR